MMTERQADALDFIKSYQSERGGVSPTLRQIAETLGFRHRSTANKLLDGLEQPGFIRRLPGKVRAIEVINKRRFAAFRFDDQIKELVPLKERH